MVLSALLAGAPAMAAEGMWTLDNPPLKAMQKDLGWAPSQAWIDKAMHGAVRLANGCSGSFVSKNGLVLTNHHCVAECLEQLSTASSDLLSTGFHARGNDEEQQCPAMEIDRLDRITDVTADVAAASQGLEGTAFKTAQNAVKARLAAACVGNEGARLRCDVVDLYHGGQFKLYRYRRFQDVRIVFAPEEAIALPPSWLAAKSRLALGVPFNLSSDNDVVGGNSGSPMLNRQGELVGLVFDGNIQSLGGAFGFDPALNRTLSVDSAAMLEALDKIYGAKALAAELRNE